MEPAVGGTSHSSAPPFRSNQILDQSSRSVSVFEPFQWDVIDANLKLLTDLSDNSPVKLGVDGDGRLYIDDRYLWAVQRLLSRDGYATTITTIALTYISMLNRADLALASEEDAAWQIYNVEQSLEALPAALDGIAILAQHYRSHWSDPRAATRLEALKEEITDHKTAFETLFPLAVAQRESAAMRLPEGLYESTLFSA